MISYLPQIYPDELVYSWLCRYYIHSGFLIHNAALKQLYCKRSDNPSKEFLGHLNHEALSTIQKIYPLKILVLEHTMFAQYARFIPNERKKIALDRICNDYCDVHHLFSVLPRTDTDLFLKYCPLCAEEDRKKYGETYWHRSHQIRGLNVCTKHNCMLKNSIITAKSEHTYTFCPAELYAINKEATSISDNNLLEFAKYLTAVFQSNIDFEQNIPIHSVLYSALAKNGYISSNGKTRFTNRLTEELTAFYENIPANNTVSFNQVQGVLLGNNFDFHTVCQIAYFLNLTIKELTAPHIGKDEIEKEQATHYMKGNTKINWQLLDIELSPILESYAKEVYYGLTSINGRPGRLSERLVYNKLKLAPHRLEKLPKCKAIFDEYTESYEENWARRIVWAYNKLKAEKKPLYWSNIRKLSGVRKENLNIVIPIIGKYADHITTNDILGLLSK